MTCKQPPPKPTPPPPRVVEQGLPIWMWDYIFKPLLIIVFGLEFIALLLSFMK